MSLSWALVSSFTRSIMIIHSSALFVTTRFQESIQYYVLRFPRSNDKYNESLWQYKPPPGWEFETLISEAAVRQRYTYVLVIDTGPSASSSWGKGFLIIHFLISSDLCWTFTTVHKRWFVAYRSNLVLFLRFVEVQREISILWGVQFYPTSKLRHIITLKQPDEFRQNVIMIKC
jgi:hypothetical protein